MNKVKILHINTYQGGGSGIAAMRLHKALLKHGYDSKFLFLDKGTITETTFQYIKKPYLWTLILRILKKLGLPLNTEQRNDYSIRNYKYKVEMFSFANTAYTHLHEHPLLKESDIIHLHWISDFIDFRSFFGNINKPVVWTLHDMNPFLGGFHYKEDEARYSKDLKALDEKQKAIKKSAIQHVNPDKLTIVTPSYWLCNLSRQSAALGRFPHYHIPNGLDTDIFKVTTGKRKENRKVNVLFVAESLHNYRKGFDLALDVLKDKDIIDACSFMAVGYVKKSSRIPHITYFGIVDTEQRMSELYNEADIFLLPSREDNLPNSMVESLCCGTPVVGFAIGGLKETITNGRNGYLSEELSSAGLKKALLTCLANLNKLNRELIAEEAHAKFSGDVQVKAFAELYQHCLQPSEEEIAR